MKLLFSFGVNRIVGFLTPEKYEVRSSFVSSSRTHHFVREEPNNTKQKRLKFSANNAIANRSAVTCTGYCVYIAMGVWQRITKIVHFLNGKNEEI